MAEYRVVSRRSDGWIAAWTAAQMTLEQAGRKADRWHEDEPDGFSVVIQSREDDGPWVDLDEQAADA